MEGLCVSGGLFYCPGRVIFACLKWGLITMNNSTVCGIWALKLLRNYYLLNRWVNVV